MALGSDLNILRAARTGTGIVTPVRALRWLRRMKGGSQPHLIEADDGHYYVVKPKDNPQHRRILVNEWVSTVFLQHLQIGVPAVAPVWVSGDLIHANPEMAVQRGSRKEAISPGLHFGSRLPGDPTQIALFDALPNALLGKVLNIKDLGGLLVFDRWVANADYRQVVFFRKETRGLNAASPGFVMWAIDHGFTFQGAHWNLKSGRSQGLLHGNSYYEALQDWWQLEPWLSAIENFPEDVVGEALASTPKEWMGRGEEREFESLLEQVFRSRLRIRNRVEDMLSSETALFPNWLGNSAGRHR